MCPIHPPRKSLSQQIGFSIVVSAWLLLSTSVTAWANTANDVVAESRQERLPTLPAIPTVEPQRGAQIAIAAYNQGNTLAEQGNINEAIAAYQRAIQLDPSNADAHYNLGYWLNAQGDFAAAENAYWQAAKLNPFDAEVYYNLGLTLRAQEKMTAANVAFERSHLLAHNNSELQTTLSILLNN